VTHERDELLVPDTLVGERVDRAVALLTGWSRAEVQALLARGAVRVDGATPAKSARLRAGARLELLDEPAPAGRPQAEPVPVDVRAADADVVVVHKPAGLVVHPGAGHEHGTLVHGLLARYPEVAEVGDPARPGIVHRLDRDTSGLLVVARSPRAYERLVADLASHDVERRYLALVRGVPAATRATVDAPIGRSTRQRARMAVRAAGRPARTTYEVLATDGDDAALLECRLETGRTHQIRVHLAAIGHPVLGDAAYGAAGGPLGRPFLHAYALAFTHPGGGDRRHYEAALPEDLRAVLEAQGIGPVGEDRPARAGDVEAG
jgi:23S rRNA pseudouridine1911/1915/1917 synthase